MAKTSIHVKPVHAGSQEHNERAKKLDHVRSDLSKYNENWTAPGYTGNADLLAKIKADYQAAHGKKLHAKATPVREGVVVIQKDTTMAQLRAAARRCEEEFGIQVLAIYKHVDEGHYQEGPTPMQNGPWVGNYHGHITWGWYNWQTHTTCKLNRDDIAAMQTIFAQELNMERGMPSTKKGLSAIQFKVQKKQEQLAALEQQGKLATARAAKLQADIAALQEKEAAAIEKLQTAEKAASREQFRSNAADVGARVMGLFGRGAVAEAKADREARDAAVNAAKIAQDARTAAEAAARRAKEEKDAYGREMYESGHAEGYRAGRASMSESIAPLQHQLAEKQATIDKLQGSRDERAETAEKELEDMVAWNPNMRNWKSKLADMREAKMKDEDIRKVFTNGRADVTIPVMHNYKQYDVPTTVAMGTTKTAANTRKAVVLFNFQDTWYTVKTFLSKALEHIRSLNPSRGIKL